MNTAFVIELEIDVPGTISKKTNFIVSVIEVTRIAVAEAILNDKNFSNNIKGVKNLSYKVIKIEEFSVH